MKIKETMHDDVAVLKVSGNLMGGPETQELHAQVRSLVGEGIIKIVVDLSAVKWLNSSGLGVLMAAYTTAKNKGGALKLAGVHEKVQSLLMITQLVNFFESHENTEKAVQSFK